MPLRRRGRDQMKVVDVKNPLDLREKSDQEPEVSAGHPYQTRYQFRDQLSVRDAMQHDSTNVGIFSPSLRR